MSRLKEDLFRKLVRELIKQELDEANSTATAGGEYQTPHAFKGSNKKVKRKRRLDIMVVIVILPLVRITLNQKTRS